MTPQTKARIVAAIAFPLLLLSGTPAHAALPASGSQSATPSRFSVEVVGKGPDVILIPGLSSSRAVFAATADRLKATHRVHLVQLKGFGEPAGPNASGPVLQPFVDDLAAYAARLGHPAIIGHSMGGLAALMLAEQHPALPGRVMVVDSLPFIGPIFGAASVEALKPQADGMRAMMVAQAASKTPDFALKPDCAGATAAAAPTPMTNSALGACMLAYGGKVSDLRVVGQAMYDDMVTDVTPRLGAIKAPVTLLYPDLGEEAGALYAKAYAGLPGVKLVKVANSRHFIMQDQPAAFAAALDSFLK